MLRAEVVEHRDVVEDFGFGFLARRGDPAPDVLPLYELNQALGSGAIMRVAAPALATGQATRLQQARPSVAARNGQSSPRPDVPA